MADLKSLNVKLFFERVLILADAPKKQSESGLIIPEESTQKAQTGTVISLGPLATTASGLPDLKVGDKVLFQKFAGFPLQLDGVEYTMLLANDLLLQIL